MSKPSVRPKKTPVAFYGVILLVVLVGGFLLYRATRPVAPVPVAEAPSAAPATGMGYLYGNPDAPITIVEFVDFECPLCAQFAVVQGPDIKTRIVDAGLANIRLFDFPLTMHPNTMVAHQAAACANDQGKFWEMHDRLFAGQGDWHAQATREPRPVIASYAEALELDMAAWNACLDDQRHRPDIIANQRVGVQLGVKGTPTILVGKQLYLGGITADRLKALVDSLMAIQGPASGK